MDARDTRAFIEVAAELLGRGKRVRFSATGGSMAPAIRHGDVLEIEPVAPDAVCRGDVVLYRRPQYAVVHRVLAVDRSAPAAPVFTIRSDATDDACERVESWQILGRARVLRRRPWYARLPGRVRALAAIGLPMPR